MTVAHDALERALWRSFLAEPTPENAMRWATTTARMRNEGEEPTATLDRPLADLADVLGHLSPGTHGRIALALARQRYADAAKIRNPARADHHARMVKAHGKEPPFGRPRYCEITARRLGWVEATPAVRARAAAFPHATMSGLLIRDLADEPPDHFHGQSAGVGVQSILAAACALELAGVFRPAWVDWLRRARITEARLVGVVLGVHRVARAQAAWRAVVDGPPRGRAPRHGAWSEAAASDLEPAGMLVEDSPEDGPCPSGVVGCDGDHEPGVHDDPRDDEAVCWTPGCGRLVVAGTMRCTQHAMEAFE